MNQLHKNSFSLTRMHEDDTADRLATARIPTEPDTAFAHRRHLGFDIVDGQRYQEMHVDGGALAQLFLYPPGLKLDKETATIDRNRRAYVIRNSRLDPNWDNVQRRTLPIAGRAIGALVQSQGIGDIYRIDVVTSRDKVDFISHIFLRPSRKNRRRSLTPCT